MRIKTVLFLIVCLGLPASVLARDDKMMYSIESAMSTAAAKQKLDRGFTYKFGDQPHGKIVSNHGEFMSNKKTNAFGKSDKEACEWVFLSAMLSFQDRIAKEGGNAVPAGSILSIMGLGIKQGDSVVIDVQGADDETVADNLLNILVNAE